MSEREIKVGSVWANGNGEVTVTTITKPPCVQVSYSGVGEAVLAMPGELFRATHRWVRDPVELPKYVRRDFGKCPPLWVYGSPKRTTEGHIEVSGLGFSHVYTDAAFDTYWEPCDPPPLVKALDIWARYAESIGTYLEPQGRDLLTEWRKIKESIK